jgi:DNA invertase Pin-like site-specific DNA recombinase
VTILKLGGKSKLIEYGRASKEDRNLDTQKVELKKAGCEKIYSDKNSGAIDDRTGLDQLLEFVRQGEWLDRLGRALKKADILS